MHMHNYRLSAPMLMGTVAALSVAALVFATSAFDNPNRQKQTEEQAVTPATATKTPPQKRISKTGHDLTPLTKTQIEVLARKLSPEDAQIILQKGTERSFCGNLLDNKLEGAYVCKLCALPLFSSDHKFESGTGWPSFFQPYDKEHVAEHADRAWGMERVEILCVRCDAHLGHVFDDGPRPTGLRFCLNSASMEFIEKGKPMPDYLSAIVGKGGDEPAQPAPAAPATTQTAYFAGGCFWGVEDRFQQVPGVIDAVSGYQGGKKDNPTYKEVCYTNTGHAEVVRVTFDASKVTYRQLLERFFQFHDPTQLNRQGPDVGTQYRSAIFTADGAHHNDALKFIEEQRKAGKWSEAARPGRKIVTEVVPLSKAGKFYEAEEYHQDYHKKHGGSCALPPE